MITTRTCAGAALAPVALLGLVALEAAVFETAAIAEPTIEIAGGVAMPVATEAWTTGTETGWKVAGRGSSDVHGLPAIASIEWARLPSQPCGHGFDRFRVTVGLAGTWPVAGTFAVSARAALGIDAVMCGTDSMLDPTLDPGLPQTTDWFDFGLAGEVAATLWLYRGSVDVGVEVGLPMSLHWNEGGPRAPALDYLGLDLDVLLALRMH